MLRSNFLAAMDIFANAMRFGVDVSRLLGGKSLFLGGSTDLTINEHGIRTGDLSGLVAPLIKWPISAIYEPGSEVALMSHWPSKIDAMARRCLGRDIDEGVPDQPGRQDRVLTGFSRRRARW